MKKYWVITLIFFCITSFHAQNTVTLSGSLKDKNTGLALPYVSIVLKSEKENQFVQGTIANEEGVFVLSGVLTNYYVLEFSRIGYKLLRLPYYVGGLSPELNLKKIEMEALETQLDEVVVVKAPDAVGNSLDKKSFSMQQNTAQTGGSVLQALQNLPGVSSQDGKIALRGNDKVVVLIDGKQTALTGFGSASGLDNLPASAVDKVEIINNPSAKYDANGNAGIINIITKKNNREGLNGKFGITTGVGALWERKANLPSIDAQYKVTPKINPSLSLNYRKKALNFFLQVDNLFTKTLNKNEFVNRYYDDGTIIHQQLKRNRNTNFFTAKTGFDWVINKSNSLTISGLWSAEKIIDHGDQPFFNASYTNRIRLWQFTEDELKTTFMATASYQHKFKQAGRILNASFLYTFHREDEKYFYTNYLPTTQGTDAFKLLSDENVSDLMIDYSHPLKNGRLETGIKFRYRNIPTNMDFRPGANSVLDVNAGGWAIYNEIIPALYSNYIYDSPHWEAELGLRIEYVGIQYKVNPNHNTYASSGYHYTQPFPTFRWAYKWNTKQKISLFYNRRVDRPNEVDIRIFPKYDDAELIKVGNPSLRPQFTNSFELGYKQNWNKGYGYFAVYYKSTQATISRIAITVPNNTLIYTIFQNAGNSHNLGMESVINQEVSSNYTLNLTTNLYQNTIEAFAVTTYYPQAGVFSAAKQKQFSGSLKLNHNIKWTTWNGQIIMLYQAPDVIPQGKTLGRFSIDFGLKKTIQNGKGELFCNATDLFNTLRIQKRIQGNGFYYNSVDYYETQVVRFGYNYKF